MIRRDFLTRLNKLLGTFPAVCVLGPRQCGKTTFIRSALAGWRYLDLERPSDAARVADDPEGALARMKEHFILDEAQRLPQIFPALRSHLDSFAGRKGRVALLGSASPSLIASISESLAGRVGFLDMAPFLWREVAAKRRDFTFENLWLRGGFPDMFLQARAGARLDWAEGYTRTFIERDLSGLGIQVPAADMRRLWTMLAHLNGGIWNASQLASSLGVSYHTVNRYLGILEQTFLVRILRPYFASLGKRMVKSPKVYFRDTGLLHYFLGIAGADQLDGHPARGASWEAFILEQTISSLQLLDSAARPYFMRTSNGAEVDLLIERSGRLIPFEIKLNSAPRRADVSGLIACMRDIKAKRGYVLYPGKQDYPLGEGLTVLSAAGLLRRSERLLRL